MRRDRSKVLTDVVERLSMCNTLAGVTGIVAEAARKLSGADGATFVLRDSGMCYYADEDAISPLWKGHRFPMEACISGWSMIHKEIVVIQDIYKDPRIPHDAYRPTFVKSLCMVPVRAEDPIAAIGNYWANGYIPNEEEIKLLQILANCAAIGLENLRLKQDIIAQGDKDRDRVGELEKQEKQFEVAIHTMAHDLRNPISTMMLFAELLQTKLRGQLDERMTGYLASLVKTGKHANEQIQKMLSLYSVSDKKLEKEEVNLSAVFEEVSQQLRVQEHAQKVELQIEPNLVAYADPQLVRMALENLISNAYKYTSKKPIARIQFSKVEEDQVAITFLVQDNGDGFDSSLASRLFHPLVRLHEDKEFPGTGLGLASVARILGLHGGSIRAEGKKGEGAKFYFSLPIQARTSLSKNVS